MAASTAPWTVVDVESFIKEYYDAWGGTDEDRIMSYYAENVVLQIPGLLMEGKEAVLGQFARPFITAFPGNRHIVTNMIFGPGVVTVEFSFEAQHKGPFAGHAATGARVSLPGCGVYEYDSAKRQITAGRIYFDMGTLLQTITDALVDDRKKSEEALQTSERNLSLITNVIPTFIHVLRADGSVLYVNQAVLGYTGLTLEDVRKEDYRARVFHPDDVERLREERAEALLRPVPFENEQRVLRKDGKYRWFLVRYNPLLDEQGRVDRWYVAAFDIEDRKRAEDALARQAAVRADVSAAFTRPTHLGEILRGCTEAIVRHLDAAFARIWMLNKDESMLELQASAGMYTRLDGSYSRIPVGDLKVGLIAREKKAHLTNDVLNDPRVNDKSWAHHNGMVAFAGYPLVVEDRLIGVVAMFARRQLSESILDTLASVADMIAQGTERKRAEEALKDALDQIQKSESNLRQVIDTIPALTWCNLPDGPNEFLSKGWHEYTGLSEEQSHGWGWQAAFHPEDLPPLMERWMKVLTSGKSDEIEARLRRHDGVYRWFLIRAEPFRDEAGKIARWYGTSTDIDDRKKAEEALRASERNLAAIINTIPTTAWTTRPDGYCDFLNQVWLDYAGMTPEQAQGWGWAEAIHPDDRERLVEEWQSCLASGIPIDTEARIRGFDSSYRWFLIRANPLRDESGNIVKWYGTCIDIEDRKRAEEELRARELDARSWLDNTPGLLCRLSPDGELEIFNRPFLRYLGRVEDEISQWRVNDIVHPDDLARTTEVFGNGISSGQPFDIEYRLRRFDGVYRWFQARTVPVRNAEGRILHWNSLVTDIDDRKKAEEALRERELDARSLLDNMPGFIGRAWPDGTPEIFNRPFLEYLGKTLEETAQWRMNDIVHPDDLAHTAEVLINMVSSGQPTDHEYRLRRFDGVYRWFLARIIPVRNAEGRILHWNSLVTDIDDRKKAEEALQSNERNLNLIINTMPTLVWSAHPDGSVDFINQRWLDYTGLSPEQASGWGWTSAIHPDDLNDLADYWQSIMRTGESGETEARFRRSDGEYRWFLFRANTLRDESGTIVKWYGINTDIDDRKRAEAQVDQAFAQLTEAQRLSHTGSFTWDVQADEHTWSSEIYRIFGFESGIKVTMQMIQSAIHPEDVPAVEATIGHAAEGADFDVPFRIITPSGELRHVHAVGHRVERIADRHVFVGAIQDVTESRTAEEALNRARSELAHMARVTTLSALTASIAHEINQPIAAVTASAGACLRWLNRDQPEVQRAREAAMRIEEDGRRASEIITHLRSFYRKDVLPQREMVSVNDIVREMLVLLRSEADHHSVAVRTELTADLPSVTADRVQLQQVLMNLMLNGMEAMSERGGELKISTRREGGDVMVSVSDTGPGIPADKMEEIFNAFFTTKAGGTGMGLAISSTIMESHGGRLWPTVNPGRGATFHFTLPTTPEA